MSFILDAIKSAVVTTEEVPEPAPAAQPAKVVAPPVRVDSMVRPHDLGEVDPKIKSILEKDILIAAKPAYSEFVLLMGAMEAAVPDANVRSAAVVAALASKGLSIKDVLFDIDECHQAIDKKLNEFGVSAANARKEQVESKKAALVDIDTRIASLHQEIERLVTERNKINEAITTSEQEISKTEMSFAVAAASSRTDLDRNRARITKAGVT